MVIREQQEPTGSSGIDGATGTTGTNGNAGATGTTGIKNQQAPEPLVVPMLTIY